MRKTTRQSTANIISMLNEAVNSDLSPECKEWIFQEVDFCVERNGMITGIELPSYDNCLYVCDLTKSQYNSLMKEISTALNNAKCYVDDKRYLELNDNHTIWELNNENRTGDDWSAIVQSAAEEFDEKTGTELMFFGRSGRHVCVELNFDNLIRYDELKAVQEEFEQQCISRFNEPVHVDDTQEAVNESAELTAEATYHDEDGTRDFTAGKLSDGRYFLIGQQEQIVVSDKDLPSLAKRDMDDFRYDEEGDKEFIEALENGTTLDKNSDLAKIIINASRKYLEDGCYLLSESIEAVEAAKRDLNIEPGSAEEDMLNDIFNGYYEFEDNEYISEDELEYEVWQKYYDEDGSPATPELVITLPNYENAANYCNGLKKDPNCESWIVEKRINESVLTEDITVIEDDETLDKAYEYLRAIENSISAYESDRKYHGGYTAHEYRFQKSELKRMEKLINNYENKKLKESEDMPVSRKASRVTITMLPKTRFFWAEGNQADVKTYFGSAEEHDMDTKEFQLALLNYDEHYRMKYGKGGYDKVKYVMDVNAKIEHNDGTVTEEDTTYTGRIDCGDGIPYVYVDYNIKNFMEQEFPDAEIIVKSAYNEGATQKYVMFYLNGKELGGHDLANEFEGERESARELLAYENKVKPEDIEVKIVDKPLNESTISDKELKDIAELSYETGHPFEDFEEFRKVSKDDGHEVTEEDYNKYLEYFNEIKARLNESEDHEAPDELLNLVKEELAKNNGKFPDTIEYKGKVYQSFNVMSSETSGENSQVYYCNMENTPSGHPQESNDYFFVNASLNKVDNGYKGVKDINYVEDLTEAEEMNGKMTIAEYALRVRNGEFDSDVCDTEIDMLVYYYCDFNEEPSDSYDKLMKYIGEHTYIKEVKSNVVICDFSSLAKPYNNAWKELFNMEYSEFDENEAYYEFVVNLEPIISGNVSDNFCEEVLKVFNGESLNESDGYYQMMNRTEFAIAMNDLEEAFHKVELFMENDECRTLVEKNNPFEESFEDINNKIKLWNKMIQDRLEK